MKTYEIISELVSQTFDIPVYIYQNYSIVFSTPVQDSICYPPYRNIHELLSHDSLVNFTEQHACFCKLLYDDNPEITFVLGPVSSLPYDAGSLSAMHRDYMVPKDKRDSFNEFFQQIPSMTYIDFFHILRVVNFMINRNKIPLDAFLKNFYAKNSHDVRGIQDKDLSSILEKKEFDIENNSYEIEKELLSLIESGNIEGMKNFISHLPQYHAGTVAGNALRIQKNYFISSFTLATRTAIRAGVPTNDAYHLSDLYIKKVETLTSMNTVNQLFLIAMFDITALVKKT